MQKRIALFGGSFDPIHLAHTALAVKALEALHVDGVELIPAANPWQRAPLTDARHRLKMVDIAIEGLPGLSVNPIEIQRGGASYTLDTLRQLHAQRPQVRWTWVLGADQLANFCTWHQWQAIVDIADLAVAARPGSQLSPPDALQQALTQANRQLSLIPMEALPISSSNIRERLQHNQSVQGLLDPRVLTYIREHHLYQQ